MKKGDSEMGKLRPWKFGGFMAETDVPEDRNGATLGPFLSTGKWEVAPLRAPSSFSPSPVRSPRAGRVPAGGPEARAGVAAPPPPRLLLPCRRPALLPPRAPMNGSQALPPQDGAPPPSIVRRRALPGCLPARRCRGPGSRSSEGSRRGGGRKSPGLGALLRPSLLSGICG